MVELQRPGLVCVVERDPAPARGEETVENMRQLVRAV